MKRTVLILAALFALAGLVHAQSLGRTGDSPAEGGTAAPCALGPDGITQSIDCSIRRGNGIACHTSTETTDNQYLRRFFLTADHGIISPYTVTHVDLGVEVEAPGGPGPCRGNPVTVNTYSIRIGADFLYANMNLLDSTMVNLGGRTGTGIINVAVGGTVDPLIDDLVVEYVSCDHNELDDGGILWPGSNTLGETQPSYIAAADCGEPEPTSLDELGFPDSDNVLVVNGLEDGGCVANLAEPRAQRRNEVIKVQYDLSIQHNRADTRRPITLELRDTAGNVLAEHSLGIVYLETGRTVSFAGRFNALGSIAAGWYVLAAKIEGMNGFREVKRLVRID